MKTGGFFELAADSDSVVSMGVFDGAHRGHQHLLSQAIARARGIGCLAVVITLHPRPSDLLRSDPGAGYLATLEERVRLLGDLGPDCVAVLSFDREVAATPAGEFVGILRERYRMAELWVGPDFALGRGREGTIPVLRGLGARLGFSVHVVERLVLEGQSVSSTLVRQRLAEGDVAAAARLLGRRFSASGPVVAGAGRGRLLGLPTANVAYPGQLALPVDGVYVVRCELVGGARALALEARAPGSPVVAATSDPTRHDLIHASLVGVANVGTRPTFDNGKRTLEVHLLDFAHDIYGATLRVEFVQRLRPELRFPSAQALLDQIRRDVEAARLIAACRG